MAHSPSSPRARLAPSPTGVLHLGNARSFVLAWLAARSEGAWLQLRIEDLDGPRVRAGATESILEDFAWLGLDWDSGPLTQADRVDEFQTVLDQLHQQGQAYPCICSRRDIEQAASAPHAGEEGLIYPGTCRGRFATLAQAQAASTDGRVAWRFAVPPGQTVSWIDEVAGPQSYLPSSQLGDFVIWKKDAEPAYQLAVVVDDIAAGINQVLRGDDLLPSTARQLLLYEALGHAPPRWLHVPLVVGTDGRRLAKRHGDTSLRHLRACGVSASQVLCWIARVSGIGVEEQPQSARALLPGFDLAALPRQAVVWHGPQDLDS